MGKYCPHGKVMGCFRFILHSVSFNETQAWQNTTRKTFECKEIQRVLIEMQLTVKLLRTLNRSKRSVHNVLLFIQFILRLDHITHMKYLHNRGLPRITTKQDYPGSNQSAINNFWVFFALLNYDQVLCRAGEKLEEKSMQKKAQLCRSSLCCATT